MGREVKRMVVVVVVRVGGGMSDLEQVTFEFGMVSWRKGCQG